VPASTPASRGGGSCPCWPWVMRPTPASATYGVATPARLPTGWQSSTRSACWPSSNGWALPSRTDVADVPTTERTGAVYVPAAPCRAGGRHVLQHGTLLGHGRRAGASPHRRTECLPPDAKPAGRLALDLERFVRGDLSGLIDGPTSPDIDLAAPNRWSGPPPPLRAGGAGSTPAGLPPALRPTGALLIPAPIGRPHGLPGGRAAAKMRRGGGRRQPQPAEPSTTDAVRVAPPRW
jgi:hypothetical protein